MDGRALLHWIIFLRMNRNFNREELLDKEGRRRKLRKWKKGDKIMAQAGRPSLSFHTLILVINTHCN